ncbi:hypothetical protein ACQE3E_18350 [Methylomonas sp. MED-D]|uniref:Uncharacterized protein n=1 Tax=Methylomonas koyamae TaxID=702114 RepID=A0A177NID9_9GAMM|nr:MULTISPECIES: hypothetical protein [Methylomonas]NJA07635.1 hypothetical protein [Methylococcaceae bacterium WWC4]MDT4332596.1 hypothetical protein [Methylomonas sp. MV1]OAI17354.1 hypothetical protein A1355_08215 [Methylomonas koyamae]OHX34599.1 hypothetical protein BJL95_18900 [Methylomonas sp. LWB]WGS85245.1 hypothetical protein QC632_19695 [Methylomonas sp. UP202]
MSAESLSEHVEMRREFGKTVCQRIAANIAKLGFPVQTQIALPEYEAAQFSLVSDPFTQSVDLVGYWYDANKRRIGQIKFHGDGSFYAEYDVVQPHPTKKQWFVEAINAWGKQDNIKTEAKLLDVPQ